MIVLAVVDDFLRGQGRFAPERTGLPWSSLAILLLACGPLHGFAMGMFAGEPVQGAFSAIKVPILLSITSALCLPSFFVFHSVLGLRDDFAAACRAVFAAQTALAVCLVGLTPVLLFVYASTSDYPFAVFFNGVLFAIATIAAQKVLSREYAVLVQRDPKHRITRRLWTATYVFIAIQLAWVLRPFIGSPGVQPSFFREGAWSNAYVVVADLIWRVVG